MDAVKIRVNGNWAQFRKAETNNNPLSHDFMTKTAFVGLLGAVIGINREDMRDQFPLLCDGLLFGLQVNNAVVKQSWGFTLRSVSNSWDKSPKQMEFIKNPDYTIICGLKDNACAELFEKFKLHCQQGKACYSPVLGLHNCPADISFIETGSLAEKEGVFETLGFVTDNYKPIMDELTTFRIGFDKIPTYQNNDFWNIPERYVSVVYPSNQSRIKVQGAYYEFNDQTRWCLI
jgi:CRISPR-associated protein Cas5 subtype I-B